MTAIKYTFAKDTASLNKIINSAISSATTMKNKVQLAVVAIIKHTHDNGDYTGFDKLVTGLGNGVNVNALVEYICTFTGLVVDEENKCFTGKVDKKFILAQFPTAKAKMWYDFKPQNPWVGFDLNAELDKLTKKAVKAQERKAKANEADKDAEVVVDKEQLAKVVALLKAQ